MKNYYLFLPIAVFLASCLSPKISIATNYKVESATIFFDNENSKVGKVEFPLNDGKKILR